MLAGDTLSHEDRGSGKGRPVRPVLIVVLEADRPRSRPLRIDLTDLSTVEIGRGGARALEIKGKQARLTLPDGWMSSRHASVGRVLGRFSSLMRRRLCGLGRAIARSRGARADSTASK